MHDFVIKLPTVVQWRARGGCVSTPSLWGRTATGKFKPDLAHVSVGCGFLPELWFKRKKKWQQLQILHSEWLFYHLQHPYLWASSLAAAWHWWSDGWAAGRRAESVTRPPLCEYAACPQSLKAGARRSLLQRHSRCLCCHLQDGREKQHSMRYFSGLYLKHCVIIFMV